MHRILLAVAGLLVTAIPALPQTLRISLRQDLDVMDPTLTTSYVARIVLAGLCDKLFDIDGKLNVVPQLATGYEWSDDRTLVIHLRSGVRFQDGETMDADAVKYSLERHLTLPGSFRKSEISSIDHIEVVDPSTVRIVLKNPSGAFLAQLTDRSGMIYPPKATGAAGKDFALHPVCSGPFSFVDRVAQDHVTLERFPGYWDAKDIHFDRVVYQILPDNSVRLANLQAGTTDITEYLAPTDVATVKVDPRLKLAVSDALGYIGLINNVGLGPRSDTPYGRNALVRQALDAAIDRTALVNVVFNGMFAPNVQPVAPNSPFYDEALPSPPREVAKAKALLRQAGVTPPVALELLTPNQPDTLQAAEVIQSMAAEAGFDIHIAAMEVTAAGQIEQRGDYQIYLNGWSGRVDPDGNTFQFLHTGQGNNFTGYINPMVDRLLEQGRDMTDTSKRRIVYQQAWAALRRDLPITFLYSPRNIVAMTARLQGFRPVPDGMIRVQGLEMAK
ncbi:MAG: ABC transporter substrate-binding protein [Acetobacteraceae bacterium]|jgi:peptide/nickel transport system substrate-binding protein